MDHIKVLGLSLLAIGLSLACQPKSDSAPETTNTAGTGGGGGSGGMTAETQVSGAGGEAEDTVRKGERGSSCDSTSDCEDTLSCIVTHDCPTGVACANKSCQPSNFNLTGTGKTCHVSDCKTKADCCGEMPTVAPKKCDNRESICNRPTLAGCTAVSCSSLTPCGGGGNCEGRCYLDNTDTCQTAVDCTANTCDTSTGYCTISGTSCTSTANCTTNTCSTPYCNCANPDYLPTLDICTDTDCQDICGFTCKDDRCVADTTCNSDVQCAASLTTPYCSEGKCSECRTTKDCEAEGSDEKCVAGRCGPACKADTQCSLFEACQSGECVFVGCRSDRECVLQARANTAQLSQDPRLAKCSIANSVGTCVFPCEIDAQCAPSEVCAAGVCKYIGCETDGECITISGLHNLPVPTPERPWTTTAVCRAEDAATP